ncbi:MAG: glycosyltransferase, partial [Candidatus Omnitrophota bacterium]
MTVSIIIAVKTWQKNLEDCVGKCLQLDFSDFEILILPDQRLSRDIPDSRVKVIPTGPVNPAKKRDIALKYARGQIIAFLDDDAYPEQDWLKNAVRNFDDECIAAVGGPAVTPGTDSLNQVASGLVYSALLVSGKYVYRYRPGKRIQVDDYPSCNFLVRKSVMDELGGFNTDFWPGEDTKLCRDITKILGKKIIYDPSVLVSHHRRSLYRPHLNQIANYAFHRGYFVKRYPETSFRIPYFIPSLFLSGLLAGAILSLFFAGLRPVYLFCLFLYLSLVFIFTIYTGLKDALLYKGVIKKVPESVPKPLVGSDVISSWPLDC